MSFEDQSSVELTHLQELSSKSPMKGRSMLEIFFTVASLIMGILGVILQLFQLLRK